MNTKQAWDTGRPILSRMPNIYIENEVTDYLTAYWDDLLIENKAKLDDLPRQLDPTLCDVNWLDYLAPLCGFTGEYWDASWPVSGKRQLLANSYTFIWPNKGSRLVLSFVLNALGVNHRITTGQNWIIGKSQLGVDTLGSSPWEYQIKLPTYYKLNGQEFKLATKINKLYGPLWCKSQILYDYD